MRRLAVLVAVLLAALLAPAAASAHPLGNATVNHYDGLRLFRDHVEDTAVEDVAEIPTVARADSIDSDGDGTLSVDERARYAASQCAAMLGGKTLTVGDAVKPFAVTSSSYTEKEGQAGLQVGRLVCELRAGVNLDLPQSVSLSSTWDSAGIGWHEITAVATGLALQNSPVPATSISNELAAYPNDLLSSPLDVRSATLRTTPDGTSTYAAVKDLPVAGAAVRAIAHLTNSFNSLVGRKHLTVGVGLLAVLLAMLLGAGHAFLPGHGKTIMAAYLVGKRGRLRDVVLVGATVTLTHTLGVLVIGAAISLSAAFAPTEVLQDLSVLSGLIVMGVGVGLLVSAVKRRKTAGDDIAEGFVRATAVPALADEVALAVTPHEAFALAGVGATVASSHGALLTSPVVAALPTHGPDDRHSHEVRHEMAQAHEHGDRAAHEHAHDHAHEHDGEPHAHGHDGDPHAHGHDHAVDHGHHEHAAGHHDGHDHGDAGRDHDHGDAAHEHDHGDAGHDHPHPHAPDEKKTLRQRVGAWIAGGHSHGPGGHSHGPGGHDHGPGGHDHGPGGHGHGPGGHDHGTSLFSGGIPAPAGGPQQGGFSRAGLIGLGAAGGLVPSPSALLVLLGTIALGRTVFGVTLVLAYGTGMALALTSAGLLFVTLQARVAKAMTGRRIGVLARFAGALPIATATLVLLVGLLLVTRALAGNV